MNEFFLLRALVALGAWTLETTAVLTIAWRITLLFRKNAAQRHLTWLTAFAALLLLPLLSLFLPARYVVPVPWPTALRAPLPRLSLQKREDAAQAQTPFPAAQRTSPTALFIQDAGTVPAERPNRDWTPVIVGLLGVWLAGVVGVLSQGVCALYGLGLLRRRSVPGAFPSHDLARLAARVGLQRRWELRVSATTLPPSAMTWGFLCPMVLLPQEAVGWPKERLEVVLLHELAHIHRYDSVSQLLSLAVCAFYWFHPAVWFCARAMRAEAEMAADDTVLRCGFTPSTYAAELLRFAAQLDSCRHPFARIGVSIMQHSKIEARITSIVDPANHRHGVTAIDALKAVGLFLFLTLLLVSVRPSLSFAETRQEAPATLKAGQEKVKYDGTAALYQRAAAIEDMRRGKGNAHGKGRADEAAAQRRRAALIKAAHGAEAAARAMADADAASALQRQTKASQFSKDTTQ